MLGSLGGSLSHRCARSAMFAMNAVVLCLLFGSLAVSAYVQDPNLVPQFAGNGQPSFQPAGYQPSFPEQAQDQGAYVEQAQYAEQQQQQQAFQPQYEQNGVQGNRFAQAYPPPQGDAQFAQQQAVPQMQYVAAPVQQAQVIPAQGALLQTAAPVVAAAPPVVVPAASALLQAAPAAIAVVPDAVQDINEKNIPALLASLGDFQGLEEDQVNVPVATSLMQTSSKNQARASVSVSDGATDGGDDLAKALEAVKENIVNKAKQMKQEKSWVKQVLTLVEEMNGKVKKVNENIETLRGATINLLKKKRQIENAQLQKKLEAQLKSASTDLQTLQEAISHVRTKEEDFVKNKDSLARTISDIEQQLTNLRSGDPNAPLPGVPVADCTTAPTPAPSASAPPPKTALLDMDI